MMAIRYAHATRWHNGSTYSHSRHGACALMATAISCHLPMPERLIKTSSLTLSMSLLLLLRFFWHRWALTRAKAIAKAAGYRGCSNRLLQSCS